MKKEFWKSIVFLLTGLIAGVILADKIGLGVEAIYKGKFRIKQSGRGNTLNSDLKLDTGDIPVKNQRRAKRIVKRIEQKKEKAERRLEKIL